MTANNALRQAIWDAVRANVTDPRGNHSHAADRITDAVLAAIAAIRLDALPRERIEQARADIEAEAQRREARHENDSWLGLAWANDTLRAALDEGSSE